MTTVPHETEISKYWINGHVFIIMLCPDWSVLSHLYIICVKHVLHSIPFILLSNVGYCKIYIVVISNWGEGGVQSWRS